MTRQPPTSGRDPQPADQHAYRAALGLFATGVTVVATPTPEGQVRASTANSFTSVSLEPRLVLVCLASTSRTLAAITTSGVLSVNVLRASQEDVSRACAGRDRPPVDLDDAGPGDRVGFVLDDGCPLLSDSLVSLRCAVHALHPGGDHTIVVAEVHGVLRGTGHDPLVFHRGRYHVLADPVAAALAEAASYPTRQAS